MVQPGWEHSWIRLAKSLFRFLFWDVSRSPACNPLLGFEAMKFDEDEERELLEVMDEVELEREWREVLRAALLSGELGQELCGEVGGVGGRGGRSAGVSFITWARGEIGTGTHSPSAMCTTVGCTVITLYGGGNFMGLKLKGFSVWTSAEGGGVACP